jgi:cytochrome c oxidase subunit I+III
VTVSTPHDRLERTWGTWPGLAGWLAAVNHRTIGTRYMVTAFIFFLVAGVEALIMRVQLSVAGLEIIHPDTYNQLFTMHGTTMMFLFLLPFLEGLGIYLVPLMIGARDMVFPRLNAFGYWVYLVSGVMLHWSLLTGTAPDSGWFNYPPLSGIGFNPGPNIDYWVTLITFLEVAALVAAVELIVTVFMQRAPGMSLNRMPLFVWAMLVTAFMIVFAMPPLVVASMMLGLDRFVGTHFFNVAFGGDPLLWQHLFWFFGHPDVYIMLVPALGITAAIVPVFARRPIAGYTLLVVSLVAIGFLSFGLWVHHMYAVGLPIMGMNFFVAASMMIIVPSGVQILAWIVTIWRGALVIRTPFLYVVAFIVLFILGGITGIMVASAPFDWQVHDTFFIVGHFHYVLVGAVVFPVFAAISYWFPKVTGRMLDETVGRAAFWVIFVSFHLTFFPMHILGFQGMPRRVYTYLPDLQWDPLNLVVTIGAFLMAAGVMIFLANLLISARAGEPAGDNPWGADTLEWATTSPPPMYNFRRIPRRAERQSAVGRPRPAGADERPGVRMARGHGGRPARAPADDRHDGDGRRAGPRTRAAVAEPLAALDGDGAVGRLRRRDDPLVAARRRRRAGGRRAHRLALADGGRRADRGRGRGAECRGAAGPAARAVAGLGRHGDARGDRVRRARGAAGRVLLPADPPDGVAAGRHSAPGRAAARHRGGPARRKRAPDVAGGAGGARGRGRSRAHVAADRAAAGRGYLALKVVEHARLEYSATSHAYGSIVWTISGYSALHVLAVLVLGSVLWLLHHRGTCVAGRVAAVEAIGVYWYFVALSTVPVFMTLYVAPYFM